METNRSAGYIEGQLVAYKYIQLILESSLSELSRREARLLLNAHAKIIYLEAQLAKQEKYESS